MIDRTKLFAQAKKSVDKIMSGYGHWRPYNALNSRRGDGVIGQRITSEKAKIAKESQYSRQEATTVDDLVQNLLNLYLSSVKIRLSESNRKQQGGKAHIQEKRVAIYRETGRCTDYDGYDKEMAFDHDEYKYVVGVTIPQFKGPGSLEEKIVNSLETLRCFYGKQESKMQGQKGFSYSDPLYRELYRQKLQIEHAKEIIRSTERRLSSFNIEKASWQITTQKDWENIKNIDSAIELEKTKNVNLEKESKQSENDQANLPSQLNQQIEVLLRYKSYLTIQENLLKARDAIMKNRTTSIFPIADRESEINKIETKMQEEAKANQQLLDEVKKFNLKSTTVLIFDNSSTATVFQCKESLNNALKLTKENTCDLETSTLKNRKRLETSATHLNFLQAIKSTYQNPKDILEKEINEIIENMRTSISQLFGLQESSSKEKLLSM